MPFWKCYTVLSISGNPQEMDKWNPMEDDFLSSRNLFKINDEDAGSAVDDFGNFFWLHC